MSFMHAGGFWVGSWTETGDRLGGSTAGLVLEQGETAE
jgi:hypothetical protein